MNEEIKEIEGKEDDDNSNFDSKSDINWHEETNKSNISGFYTNYPSRCNTISYHLFLKITFFVFEHYFDFIYSFR